MKILRDLYAGWQSLPSTSLFHTNLVDFLISHLSVASYLANMKILRDRHTKVFTARCQHACTMLERKKNFALK